MFRKVPFALVPAIVAGSLLAAGPAFAQGKITLSSGAPGGSWYGISAGLAKLLSDKGVPTTAEQGQGNSNVINVEAGRVETAFAFATALHHAKKGSGVFKKAVKGTNALATMFEQAQHTLVTVDSGVNSFADLKGKRFASHTTASSARLVFLDILKVHGLTGLEDDLNIVVRGGPAVGSKAVQDRQAVGMHGAWYPPAGAITQVAVARPSKLLPISDAMYKELMKLNEGYKRATIPAGVYKGIDVATATVSAATVFITDAKLPEKTGYDIVRIMAENMSTVQSINPAAFKGYSTKFMANTKIVPYHPGAMRYYREKGVQ